MMPAFIRGVINLRGSVVPVIDLSARFGGRTTETSRRTCIVIIELAHEDERHDIGIVVDAVSEVLEVSERRHRTGAGFGAKIRADFIAGMGKIGGKFVIILDIQKVLSVDEIATLATVSDNAAPSARRFDTPERLRGEAMKLTSIRVRLLLLFATLALGLVWYLFANVRGELLKIGEGAIASRRWATWPLPPAHWCMSCKRNAACRPASSVPRARNSRSAAQAARGFGRAAKSHAGQLCRPRRRLAAGFVERMRKANDAIAALEGKRGEISALKLAGPDSFGFYSASIENYLAAVGSIAPSLGEAGMMRKFSAYVMFLGAKEYAGRERATVNGIFAAKESIKVPVFQRLQGLITAQDLYLAQFRGLAEPASAKALADLLAAKPAQETLRMRGIAIEQAFLGNFEVEPATWFAAITAKIDAMKLIEDQLAADIAANAAQLIANARRGLGIAVGRR
jgi:chemotaxis signal transduction protein